MLGPHCRCCDLKESVTVRWFCCGFFGIAHTTQMCDLRRESPERGLLLLLLFVAVVVVVVVVVLLLLLRPQLYLWGSPFWVRYLSMRPFFGGLFLVLFFKSNHGYRSSRIPSSWMVRAGYVFVAGIHESRTLMSGSFESVRWNACVRRLDLGLRSHPKGFWGNGVQTKPTGTKPNRVRTHVNYKGTVPSAGGSKKGRTRDAVPCRTASPTPYQLSYSGPRRQGEITGTTRSGK